MIKGIKVNFEHPLYGPINSELAVGDAIANRRINQAMDEGTYFLNAFHPACKVHSVESITVSSREDLTMNGKFGCE